MSLHHRSAFFPLATALVALCIAVFLTGCDDSPTSGATSSAEAQQPGGEAPRQSTADEPKRAATHQPPLADASTAEGVLKNMVAAYRNADSYADSGKIHFEATFTAKDPAAGSGEPQEIKDQAPFSITLARPNKLRMHVYLGNLISDGQQMRGLVEALPGQVNTDQVLALPAPAKLTLDDVYADAVLAQYLTSGMAGASVQLLLLLDDKPLEKILEGAEAPQLVEPKPLEDRLCYRVRAKRGDGDLVLWIDQKSYELRRIDFPIDELKKQFAEQAEVKQLAVWADFAGARLNAKIDDKAFQIELPPEAKLVKKFDQRSFNPPPPPPSPLLGKAAPEFSLKDLEGNAVSVKDLEGQVAVLDFWFTTCPPCRETLPNLEKVYQRYKDHPKVRFLAVSVDPADIPAANLKQMFTDLRLNIPIARDDEQKAAQALGIEGYPTLMVLGSDGTVQHHETGVNPELAAALPAKLEKLIAGQSVFEETLREYQARKAEYDQANKEPEVPKAEIAAKSEPQKLKLAQLWNCKELKQPGNILVISEQGKTRLLVHDGWDAVAELGADGKLVARHDLKLGQDDVVSYLRTAVDAKGRRYYLGLANSRPQVFLFDDKFQRLLAYPEDRDHAGIADALLVDLDGEGLKMAVSYWGQVGVQYVSLDGKRLWSNRSMEHVFRISPTGANAAGHRRLACVHGQGSLVLVNHAGSESKPIAVGTRFLRHITSDDLNGDGQLEYLAIAANNAGVEFALGITLAGGELWSYSIPGGVQPYPVEMVTSGRLAGSERQWIIAGPDGSIHILSSEGEPVDRFNYGSAISGIAVTELEGKRALLVATPQGVDAWIVSE